MAINWPEATDAAPIRAEASAEDGGGATFLPREEWAIRGPRAAWPAWGGLPGEESRDAPLRHRRSRRSRPSARSRNRRGRSGAVDGQERRERAATSRRFQRNKSDHYTGINSFPVAANGSTTPFVRNHVKTHQNPVHIRLRGVRDRSAQPDEGAFSRPFPSVDLNSFAVVNFRGWTARRALRTFWLVELRAAELFGASKLHKTEPSSEPSIDAAAAASIPKHPPESDFATCYSARRGKTAGTAIPHEITSFP
jgi:hypothetical protein